MPFHIDNRSQLEPRHLHHDFTHCFQPPGSARVVSSLALLWKDEMARRKTFNKPFPELNTGSFYRAKRERGTGENWPSEERYRGILAKRVQNDTKNMLTHFPNASDASIEQMNARLASVDTIFSGVMPVAANNVKSVAATWENIVENLDVQELSSQFSLDVAVSENALPETAVKSEIGAQEPEDANVDEDIVRIATLTSQNQPPDTSFNLEDSETDHVGMLIQDLGADEAQDSEFDFFDSIDFSDEGERNPESLGKSASPRKSASPSKMYTRIPQFDGAGDDESEEEKGEEKKRKRASLVCCIYGWMVSC